MFSNCQCKFFILILSAFLTINLFAQGYYPVGDINGDLVVNFSDLKAMSEQWLEPSAVLPEHHTADLDGINGVNAKDYAILMADWQKQTTFSASKIVEWKMDESTGSTVYDTSGNGNNGIAYNGPAKVPGLIGNCLGFDGDNDYVYDSAASGLPLGKTDRWTMNVFLYPQEQISGWSLIAGFGKAEASTSGRYLYNDTVSFHGEWSQSDEPWSINQWQMVTVTYDGTNIAIYKNGEVVLSHGRELNHEDLTQNKIYLASQVWSSSRFKGKIDEFTIWDDVLTQDEIKTLAKILPAKPTKVLSWTIDAITGPTVEDFSGYDNDGAIQGTPSLDDGIYGKCLGFNGGGDICIGDDLTSLPIESKDPWTFNAYVYCDSLPAGPAVIAGFGDGSGTGQLDKRYIAVTADGKIGFWNGVSVTSTYTDFDIGKWQMITVTYDGNILVNIYKNGTLLGVSIAPLTDALPKAAIGGNYLANEFNGKVDEFSIWTGQLLDYEIALMVRQAYHIDSVTGNDTNSGASPSNAWKSLNKVNSMVFQPGDRILFKTGTRYIGQLKPQGSGIKYMPIVIASYGDSSRPLISSNGLFLDTVLLENEENWEITDLEITNTNGIRVPERNGVKIKIYDYGTAHHIHLKNLFIRDVYGSLDKSTGSLGGNGILWEFGGTQKYSNFYDLLIENCHLLRTDRNGICALGWYDSYNVVIRGNYLQDIGGDGIVPMGTDGCLIEHNIIDVCGRGMPQANGGEDCYAGIWPYAADNTIIQFNEVMNLINNGCDSQSFDSDNLCYNSIFQYNYSHDNPAGFILICNEDGSDTTVRYNISLNDGAEKSFIDIWSNEDDIGGIEDMKFYNNVFYTSDDFDMTAVRRGNAHVYNFSDDFYFANNIFFTEGTIRWQLGMNPDDFVFENNVFYGNHINRPFDPQAILQNPQFVNPGSGAIGFDTLEGYKLQSDSPCIGEGKTITNNGGYDFWGNPLYNDSPDVGAHEK